MIRTQRLEKRYGRFQALHPLDLHVRSGEIFGFLGPNGAGKTTTIRLLAGVLPPSSGRIWMDGVDLLAEPEKARRRVGFIPDRPYLHEKLTGVEFLEFVAGVYGLDRTEARRRIGSLLEEYELSGFADALVEGYSHGMKQRLVLCATLLHEPRVLVVDEPMVGLDPRGARQVKDVFRQLGAEGRAIFLSTHSLDVAEEVCDRIAIIHHGRLVALGTVDELRRHVASGAADLEAVFLKIVGDSPEVS
ncbi:MAG: ABC transporter ATP-binding protein [Deltaproteobacteria bacterium]|nr:ABC transporter ATP-binding protein [Deltaproteobacteria bacterium]